MKIQMIHAIFISFAMTASCQNNQKQSETIAEAIDTTATANKDSITKTKGFEKTLSLQNISFNVTADGEGSLQNMTIIPSGLSISNDTIKTEVDGKVINAEIADLNADGSPELLVFTVSAGSGSYGNVMGYSVNNGKSVSMIYFPSIAEDKILGKGYMGHDEFSIVDNKLIQKFPVYKDGDANSSPSGGSRQISYRLINGEASRKFIVDKITAISPK